MRDIYRGIGVALPKSSFLDQDVHSKTCFGAASVVITLKCAAPIEFSKGFAQHTLTVKKRCLYFPNASFSGQNCSKFGNDAVLIASSWFWNS